MADYREYEQGAVRAGARADIDEGLRSYMLGIYNYMATAIGLTGVAAFGMATWASNNPAVANALYNSPLKWVIMLSPLAFVMVISFGINKNSSVGIFLPSSVSVKSIRIIQDTWTISQRSNATK